MSAPQIAAKEGHWAQINEASFVVGMKILFWICRIFGRWPFRIALYPVLVWYMLAKPRARAASAEYLQRVAARRGKSIDAVNLAVLRHLAAFGECILDKLLLWGGLFDTAGTTVHGSRALDEDIARQRGGLIICAHFGNLELSRVLGKRCQGLKLTALVHTKHAQKFNRLLERLDPESQVNLLQVTEISPATAMMLTEKVASGEFVVIAGDRIPVSSEPRVAFAPFLGKDAPFPIGPYVLASLMQCPVYLMFCMQVGNKHEIHFERFRDSVRLPRKDRNTELAVLARDYAARLEHFCLRAPYQWFNFYDFWRMPGSEVNDASR